MTDALRGLAAAALVFLLASPAPAAGGTDTAGDSSDDPAAQAYLEGEKAADAGNWALAVVLFGQAASLDPDDADAYNMLAYSQRRAGDLESAFVNYDKALALDPDHEGAREYLGEAYLAVGDVDAAREQLEALDDICRPGCEAYLELKEAIERWEEDNG